MDKNTGKAVFFSVLLALQFGLQPLIARRFAAVGASKSSLVIGCEIGKIFMAITSLLVKSRSERMKILGKWTWRDSLYMVSVPAALYTIQNLLVQVGYELVDSMTFSLLNQTKTLSAAFCLWMMFGQRQSYMQIVALILLFVAALTLNLNSFTISPARQVDNKYQLGVIIVLGSSLLSGLSAAFGQRVFLADKDKDAVFFSAEMAVYGIFFILAKDFIISQYYTLESDSYANTNLFANWDTYTLIPVLTNSFGGLLVGIVTKCGGTVVKGFSMIAGLLVTALAQWLIEQKPLGIEHYTSALLVMLSIYLHTNYPVKKKMD